MEIKELRELIEKKVGWDRFEQYVDSEFWYDRKDSSEKSLSEKLGLEAEWIGSERNKGSGDFDGYAWRFKIDGKVYELEGYYSSYEGTQRETSIEDFYEVEPVEQTIIVYKKVK